MAHITKFALDRTYWSLLMCGPMTLEQLAAWLDKDQHAVNGWLYKLRRAGLVELVERREHRNGRGARCGRWRVIPSVAAAEMAEIRNGSWSL